MQASKWAEEEALGDLGFSGDSVLTRIQDKDLRATIRAGLIQYAQNAASRKTE